MRKSIATVSMSGTLRAKLEAIAAARFDGYELFENDLIHFNGSPAAAGALAADLGLTCELYQPFRDLEGTPDATFRRSLDRAERKFDVMQQVGAKLMLVCSNTSADVLADEERAAAQLHELAEQGRETQSAHRVRGACLGPGLSIAMARRGRSSSARTTLTWA
jgi:4-hydroxyphenylpyruvate dioxygenase